MPVKTFYLRAKTSLALLLAALCSLPSFADVTLDQLEFTLTNDGSGYSVRQKYGTKLEGALYIPEIYNGLPVTRISDRAFEMCDKLTHVSIPNSVTYIGEGAFVHCYSLATINIPNSVPSIESGTFTMCSELTQVSIPNSVTTIGNYAFSACSSLSQINIPNSVTSIGDEAFSDCGLLSLIIPSSVISLGDYVTGEYSNNVKIAYPDDLNAKFDDRYWIPAIRYPRNAIIENGVIYNAYKTKLYFATTSPRDKLIIPSTVTEIGDYACAECSISDILLPPSISSVGKNSFGMFITKRIAFPQKFAQNINLDFYNVSIPYPDDCIESDGMIYSPDKSVLYFAPSTLAGEYTVPAELK